MAFLKVFIKELMFLAISNQNLARSTIQRVIMSEVTICFLLLLVVRASSTKSYVDGDLSCFNKYRLSTAVLELRVPFTVQQCQTTRSYQFQLPLCV